MAFFNVHCCYVNNTTHFHFCSIYKMQLNLLNDVIVIGPNGLTTIHRNFVSAFYVFPFMYLYNHCRRFISVCFVCGCQLWYRYHNTSNLWSIWKCIISVREREAHLYIILLTKSTILILIDRRFNFKGGFWKWT